MSPSFLLLYTRFLILDGFHISTVTIFLSILKLSIQTHVSTSIIF
ncbi:MAG: hypothetical protein Q8S84_04950 [bacterium]|nr:hypothetical protein [bacterium]